MIDISTEASYNELPYPSLCYTQTHPDRLATIATLLGVEPAPVDHCRVLELGAAAGGNLIPMAYALPGSDFVGIDYAARQVESGRQVITALELENVQLLQQDILDINDHLGPFDYIIAHGIYSWTLEPVREKVLAVCRQHLAPQGVAFVSYNAFPGWHNLLAIREMMQYHGRQAGSALARAQAGRALVSTLAEMAPAGQAFGHYVRSYHQLLERRGEPDEIDAFLLHDELEQINQPFYFHEFINRAAAHGLQYLAEADFPMVMVTNFQQETVEKLLQLAGSDPIALEQYMDFVRNRTLRQTLLVHQETAVQRTLNPGNITGFHIASRAKPANSLTTIHDNQVAHFEADDGARLSTDHPVSKAALLHLAAISPQSLSFNELLLVGRQHVAETGLSLPPLDSDAQVLAVTLLRGFTYSLKLVELHVQPPQFTIEITERPVASRLARWQATNNDSKVTSLRHERVSLDPFSRFILPLLDGRHTVDDLLDALQGLVDSGRLALKAADQPDGSTINQTLRDDLETTLAWLGRAGLLR